MKTDSRGAIPPITQPARATGSVRYEAGNGAGQGKMPGRPFSFAAAVMLMVHRYSDTPDHWWITVLPTPVMNALAGDATRESERFRTMRGHRLAGHLRLNEYVLHVLPVSTGHAS